MMDDDKMNHGLDGFFDAARKTAPAPSAELLARVLDDAQATQAAAGQVAMASAVVTPRPTRLRQLVDLLGGWPAMAGLATAGVAGLWLGISPPAALTGLSLAGFGEADPLLVSMISGDELDLLALEEG
ncbi:hypothetical protein M8756_03190 [Lutimaribacter sp. EGI FJ00015]|uniref:Uncharacterized protein n=1 Tax=Lutimaribacter degradans TaxID=2945989 RepID=A0ACC5ZR07_9RHOB|nr:hypothetical protein [Lutimaribacter sp. EGI FJ00013]MCM2560752.1 hypothetical protein [Lutimaribacter sp. EGI FJ00013]MCO0612302.1 hypothetical protein [Lutimaribacter sp. EGI FJ00015]MCO0634577.1 hypothetical protein [Lutimaribacter sp. EGI FJ00014]